MDRSISQKLAAISARYNELGTKLSDPTVIADQGNYRKLAKEYADLEPVALCSRQYQILQQEIEHANSMLKEAEPELQQMAAEELKTLNAQQISLEEKLQALLLPKDPNDARNVFLEIRAGTGGDEAAIFAGDLFRMYSRYAEQQRWQVEILSQSDGEHGGFKEIIARVNGKMAYGQLKFESGAHRVQRVPTTETQGRVHTSACTVAILPEAAAIDHIDINPADLKIDTYRSSGAGGQHINTTDSAVRITHIPTGTVVECQDERSQHKNRARAMSILQAKILDNEKTKQRQQQAQTRRSLVGSGDRSERIRTYNFPQNRLSDHRIGLTLYKLDEIMEGNLKMVIEALVREHQADQLAAENN